MLVPNRLRLALPLVLGLPPLDVLTPPPDIHTPPPDAKTILWIRHGQSEANAAGLLGHELLDAQLTDYGRAQAASWASEYPSLSSSESRSSQIMSPSLSSGVTESSVESPVEQSPPSAASP